MLSNFLYACRSSIQFKLFLSLTAIVALGLTAILFSQVYLVQDYFIRQAESNLRSSNYLLSRVLADPLFANDLSLLQTRLQDVQAKLPLCNFQLKDNIGTVVYKVGDVRVTTDSEFDPDSRDGCYNTIIPVVRDDQLLGTIRMGVRTDDIARARQSLIRDSTFFAMFWFVILLLPFFVQIRRMVRPLGKLSLAAQQFANGNLDYPAPPPLQGEDEVSQLTTSFQAMSQALVRNRDEQAASLAELNNEKSTLDALLTTIPVGVIFADRSHVRYCNTAFNRMFMLKPDEQFVGIRNDELLLRLGRTVTDADKFLKTIAEILEKRTLTESAYFELKDGRTLRMISNTVIATEGNRYLGRFWLFEDATEEKKRLELAEMRGEQDALTMLYNRRRYDQDLQRIIAQAERDGSRVALLVFDLDDFKPINDIHGHAAGDIVLRQIAQKLSGQMRRNEVLYRIGGDEFALLLLNASNEEVKMLAERIVQSVHSLSFEFDGTTSRIDCSLGIALFPDDADSIQSLLNLADHAMYEAKKNGKWRFSFSSSIADSDRPEPDAKESTYSNMNLGIAIMDAQHLSMANYIQGILDALRNGDKSVALRKRVDLLLELCRINYHTEEELMRSHDIPGLSEHQEEHEKQLKSLRKLLGNPSYDEQELTTLSHEVNEWLMKHIRDFDTGLAEQLRRKGAS
ncbi:MAG: diguanylate cyclase [Gammaproteobacteria bacterium]|nr:diguanylate cyclase [Gammaproteobacteria bacterium]